MGLNTRVILGLVSVLSFAACSPNKGSNNTANNNSQSIGEGTSSEATSGIIAGTTIAAGDPVGKSIVGVYTQNKDSEGGAICTGSLLPGNLVITAAHCVDDYMTIVFAPDMETAAEAQARPVDKASVSPFWQSRMNAEKDHGDIALLHFEGTVPSGYEPATLLTDSSLLKNGGQVILAGYGASQVIQTPIDVKTYPDLIQAVQTGKVMCDDPKALKNCVEVKMPGSGVLRKTTVTIADAKYSSSEVKLDQTLGTGACHGDSGGPAYVVSGGKMYLWGVTSRGVDDAKNDCSRYSAYTSILFYRTWLNREAQRMALSLTNPNRLAAQ